MPRPNRAVAFVVAALLAAGLGAGCSSSSKSSSATTTAPNKGFEVQTPDGSVSLSLNGNLPPDWPAAFPIPDGAEAAGSGALADKSRDVMVAVYTVSGSASDTYDFYKGNADLTVVQAKSVGVGGAFVGRVQFSGTYAGSTTVTGRNDTTYLVVVLNGQS